MEADGTERVRTMDDIISLKEVTDSLHEDILINIQALFLSRYGANLRNCIAHGMVSDSDFHSALCMYAWAFIFRLCYIDKICEALDCSLSDLLVREPNRVPVIQHNRVGKKI